MTSSTQRCRWHACPDERALQQAAVAKVKASAEQAIRERGQFTIVLSGGRTPRAIHAALRHARTDWNAWHIYFGDERCLPPDDSERNSRMAAHTWLDHVPIPPQQVHPMEAELGPIRAASLYATVVASVECFDLVLLGLGEDGHTASLFPGNDWGTAVGSPPVLAVFDAPKPPPERVTMSASRLSRARQVVFLVSGGAKREAVARWRAGADIPARAIAPDAGVDVLVESALF